MITVTFEYDEVKHSFAYHINGGQAHYMSAHKLQATDSDGKLVLPSGLRQALGFEQAAQLAAGPRKKKDVEEAYRLIREWEARGNAKKVAQPPKKTRKSRLKTDVALELAMLPQLTLEDLDLDGESAADLPAIDDLDD